jgi:uncharacterized protein YecT (DUF1311 family)
MKLRIIFVFLLIVVTLLIGCGKDEKIEGKVQDIFGNPIKDVTVKIQTTTFSAITDKSGNYSLDYAPGSMKLIFSKEGYTTGILDLNIQQKIYFPAEILGLCPIPSESGIFYVDFENKRLIKIEENGRMESYFTGENVGYWSYVVKFFKPVLTIKPGKSMFIDRLPYSVIPSTVKENGLIYNGIWNMAQKSHKYSGFLQDSQSNIGVENLLIRTVELSSGTYAWIKIDNVIRENALGFQIGETPTKESKSPDDSISKPNEAQPLPQSEEIKTPNTSQQTIQTSTTESIATTTAELVPPPAKTQTETTQAPPTNSTAQTSNPSFDCAKASTGSEHLICSNANLAAADVEMARIYRQVLNSITDKKALKHEQNQWRKVERDACKDVACVLNSYAMRTKQLKEKQAN